jgi:deazaflavin-dependent oxidoreductase (nitroreductase family)
MAETSPLEINARVIEQFRAGTPVDGMHRERLLLLTTTGRKSGRSRTAPMMFHLDTGPPQRHVVIASNAGARQDPEWFLNLVEDPRVHVELDDDEFDARAVVATGASYERLWTDVTARYPFFEAHREKAGRTIPLVVLERL